MILKAFLEISKIMQRLSLKDGDIEIVIRCRTAPIQRDMVERLMDESWQNGAYFVEDSTVKRGFSQGKAHGVPFRFEAMHP